MICDLLALRPISQITQKTLSYLHSTKIEQMTKTMVIFKTGAIFLCCIRCDPIPRQTSVQRLAHTRNVTTCCYSEQGSFLHEHARQLNKRCAWRLTTGSAFIKMARLKAIVAIIFLVGLGECACDLTKCVVCKKTVTWS